MYESDDKVLHCEKYPVIYINSLIVYFKRGRKQEFLDCVYVSNIADDFVKFYINNGQFGRACFDKYFWNIDTDIESIYEDLKIQRIEIREKYEEEKKLSKLEKARLDYEAALREAGVMNK